MIGTPVYLRWDGVCIPADLQLQQAATRLWRNSTALGRCAAAHPPKPPPQYGLITHAPRAGVGTTLRTPQLGVTIDSATRRFAPGQEWAWIKASIRNIHEVGCLVLQIRDNRGALVYAERLSQRQVWGLPRSKPAAADGTPPLRHVPGERLEIARDRAGLSWANPAGSPYRFTILVTKTAQVDHDTINAVPALDAAAVPGMANHVVSTTRNQGPGIDETEVRIASLQLELVPWRELYETSTGMSADVVPPGGADRIKWVQHKLDELGWFAGKLDGNANDPDLEKAIVRYRQSHPELYRPLFRVTKRDHVYELADVQVSRQIDADLVAALQADEAGLPSFDTADVFTRRAAAGKLYVHAERACQDAVSEFANDASLAQTIKHQKEQAWLSAPRFPLRAKVLVTESGGTSVWAPAASQSLEVRWRWRDQAEPTDRLPTQLNTTRAYVEAVKAVAAASSFHNARAVIGGQITGDDASDEAVVFDGVDANLTVAAVSDAWGATTTGELVFFCPSTIAGDTYEITATVGTHEAQTGLMTLWRRIRVAGHVSWGGQPSDVWQHVARKYAQAYVEIVAPEPRTMAATADDALKAKFREVAERESWCDDAWYPDPLPAIPVPPSPMSPEQMRTSLEELLNGEDRAYDRWTNDDEVTVDIRGRYLAAKSTIAKWKQGADPVFALGTAHYARELERIIAATPQNPPIVASTGKPLSGMALIRWKKTPDSVDARFNNLQPDARRIEVWNRQASIARANRPKVYDTILPVLGGTQQTMLVELERILGPGILLLEFNGNLPGDGIALDWHCGSQMIGGGKIVINRGSYGHYRASHLFTHELGHGLFLKHDKNAPDFVRADHDQSDDNCVMSYIYDPDSPPADNCDKVNHDHYHPGRFDPEFCGKCNLKLRGWNIRAKDGSIDALPDRSPL